MRQQPVAQLQQVEPVQRTGQRDWRHALQHGALLLARRRAMVVVVLAVLLPLGFMIVERATMYDGVRHILFVVPMLAIIAAAGLHASLPVLLRAPLVSAGVAGAYVGTVLATLAALHPLEYVDMNSLVGGTRGAYDRFELDYWSVAAGEALRRLEQRLDYQTGAEAAPKVVVCIPWREHSAGRLLRRPWIVETDPAKADFLIETQRWRCAEDQRAILIDEVVRAGRSFAWIYARGLDQ